MITLLTAILSHSRAHLAIRPDSEKATPERKQWACERINELREKMEDGLNIGLLASPSAYSHGSLDHAKWLYKVVGKGSDVINAACATSLNMPMTDAARASLQKGHDRSGVARKDNTKTISALDALKAVAKQAKDRKPAVYIFHLSCPHCEEDWLTNDNNSQAQHKCSEIDKLVMPARASDLQRQAEVESEAQEVDAAVPSYSAGVTRCRGSASLSWTIGQRISPADTFWDEAIGPSASDSSNRDPKPADPVWRKAMGLRGRLQVFSLVRTQILFPYQLLQIESVEEELLDEKTGELKEDKGFVVSTVEDYTDENEAFKGRLKLAERERIEELGETPIMTFGENKKWMEEQVRAILRETKARVVEPVCSLTDISHAIEERLRKGLLRPEES
jgi:hypothetical protein